MASTSGKKPGVAPTMSKGSLDAWLSKTPRRKDSNIDANEASSEPQSTSLVDGMSTTPLQPECQSADVNASVSADFQTA